VTIGGYEATVLECCAFHYIPIWLAGLPQAKSGEQAKVTDRVRYRRKVIVLQIERVKLNASANLC